MHCAKFWHSAFFDHLSNYEKAPIVRFV